MRRVIPAAAQTFILIAACLLLIWQHNDRFPSSDPTVVPEISLQQDIAPDHDAPHSTTTISSSSPTLTPTTIARYDSDISVPAAASGTATTPAPARQSASPHSLYPANPTLRKGDKKLLQAAPQFVQAIMNPQDTSFKRLNCPPPAHDRYDYLRPPPANHTTSQQPPPLPKYFFALDLYECATLLPRLLGTVVETVRFLGPENCVVSIVEGRSTDGTFEILTTLAAAVDAIGATYHFSTNDVDPKSGGGVDRIQALAALRNQALAPLWETPGAYSPDTTVVFINDVSLCMEDVLELVHQKVFQGADMTCAMDWIFGGWSFYDVWVARGMNGDQFFEIPQSGTWDFADNLFWNDEATRALLDAHQPFQVFACWNGIAAFTAKPLLLLEEQEEGEEQEEQQQTLRFRGSYPGECYQGEPTLFCKDLWYAGYGKIAVIPSVNVGYSDEESEQVKARHGTVSGWALQEWIADNAVPITWNEQPPPVIKCAPTYTHPIWVPWNDGIEAAREALVLNASVFDGFVP